MKKRGNHTTLARATARRNISLYVMLIIPMAYFLLFKYGPMYGIAAAFKDYNIFLGLKGSPWVGWKHFARVFSTPSFFVALRNTIILNLGDLFLTFPVPIILAILLGELKFKRFGRQVERIMYLPHFLSMVIIAGIVYFGILKPLEAAQQRRKTETAEEEPAGPSSEELLTEIRDLLKAQASDAGTRLQ